MQSESGPRAPEQPVGERGTGGKSRREDRSLSLEKQSLLFLIQAWQCGSLHHCHFLDVENEAQTP